METVEQYRVWEHTLPGAEARAVFRHGGQTYHAAGFCTSENRVTLRFMPGEPGEWTYAITGDAGSEEGCFTCTPAAAGNHGPVVAEGQRFRYADGTRYLPFGTTCYGWIHQPDALRAETLHSLAASPFNKVRMLLFPKYMPYNTTEPRAFPFERDAAGRWDVSRPDFAFWDDLDRQILALDALGIEADLILFHPYDRWGFATMCQADNLAYLRYAVRRLSACKNVWWSLANEYDMIPGKTEADWDAFAACVRENQCVPHLLSIHNCCQPYPDRDWMTHCSIQSNLCRQTLTWGWQYRKPVVIDECGYEGNIEFSWGNLSGFEMVHRFWTVVACGGWCTHGETFYDPDEILWWGKGGRLHGESVRRIAFLRHLLESLPGTPRPLAADLSADPNGGGDMGAFGAAMMRMPEDARTAHIAELVPMACGTGSWRLYYLGRSCPAWLDVQCPGPGRFAAQVIDIWAMTRTPAGEIDGAGRVALPGPGKEGQAVLLC